MITETYTTPTGELPVSFAPNPLYSLHEMAASSQAQAVAFAEGQRLVTASAAEVEHKRRAELAAEYLCRPEVMESIGRAAMYLGVKPDQVDDVVQDVVIRLWRNPSFFDESTGTMPKGVITTTTRWSAYDLHRSKRRRPEIPTELDDTNTYLHPHVRDHSQPTTTTMVVHEALDMLPAGQAEVLRLMFLENRTGQETADIIGIPVGTVKSRSSLGQKALRQLLADRMDIHGEFDL